MSTFGKCCYGGDDLPRVVGALGSVCFQYNGVVMEQFCQYIVSMLECGGGVCGGFAVMVLGGCRARGR